MSSSDAVTAALRAGVDEGVFPGAVLQVRRRGLVVYHQPVGRTTYAADAPAVTPDTVYDLASLTKPLATTAALLRFVEARRLDLSQPVREVLPELWASPVGVATIEHLLAHAAGLPAWKPYYERLARETQHRGGGEARQRYLEWIATEPLERAPGSGSVYSDLGFMLLGFVVERAAGMSLAEWWRLSLRSLSNPPTLDFIDAPRTAAVVFGARAVIAPTEQDPWRGRVVCGEVHDENAWALGGVAGHAGLFGSADAVAQFGQGWLDRWGSCGVTTTASLVHRFTSRVERVPGSSRALGWDTPSSPSSSGRYFSPRAFGHLGFTGTSLWIDPTEELVVALLTNRVYPSRANDKIKAFRPRLHDLVWETWGCER